MIIYRKWLIYSNSIVHVLLDYFQEGSVQLPNNLSDSLIVHWTNMNKNQYENINMNQYYELN